MIFVNSCPITLFSGVPGVKPERFEEGMKIRHCALSLVGMSAVPIGLPITFEIPVCDLLCKRQHAVSLSCG